MMHLEKTSWKNSKKKQCKATISYLPLWPDKMVDNQSILLFPCHIFDSHTCQDFELFLPPARRLYHLIKLKKEDCILLHLFRHTRCCIDIKTPYIAIVKVRNISTYAFAQHIVPYILNGGLWHSQWHHVRCRSFPQGMRRKIVWF